MTAGALRRRLPWRTVVAFAAFALAVLLLGAAVRRQAEQWTMGAATETLRATVKLGAHGMDLWLAERFADADVIAANAVLRHSMARGGGQAIPSSIHGSDVVTGLEGIRARYNYRSVSVIDAVAGNTVYVSGQAPSGQDLVQIVEAHVTSRVQWVDLPPRSAASEYRAALVRRFEDEGPLSRYVIFLEVQPLQLVRTLMHSRYADLHGESILMRRQGESLLRFTPERDPGGSLLAFVADVVPGSVEQQLLTRSHATALGKSLNGRDVIAMREALSLPGWFLVSMVDTSQVLAGVRQQTQLAAVGYGVLLVIAATGLALRMRSERFRHTEREANVMEFYDKILRHGDGLFILTDWRGKIVDASTSALVAFGYDREGLTGRDIMDLVPEHVHEDVRTMVRGMEIGEARQFLAERKRSSGDTFFVQGSVGLFEIRGHRFFHSVGRDVTHEKEVQTRLKLAASVFDLAPAAIVVADKDLKVISVNPAFTSITGYQRQEVVGRPVQELATGAEPQRNSSILAQLKNGSFWEGEVPGRRKNGEVYPRRMLAAVHRSESGEPDQYIGIFTDLSLLKQAEVKAEYASTHDALTMLPNRRRLDKMLPGQLRACREHGGTVTLAIFNIDRFQSVNDSFGLPTGNALLVEISARLRSVLPADALFHLGADEFVALLDGAPVGHALMVDRTLAQLCSKIQLDQHAMLPSISVGVASFPELAADGNALLQNAYAALKSAKAQGGKTWRLYEPGMNASAYDDMLLAVDLRTAIDEGQLELHFQPQARITDLHLVGMEALLRWKHPTRGQLPPSRFIPVAEASGLIDDLSKWVLGEACSIWAGWRNAGLAPPAIAVNVSALQFKHNGFTADVARTIARHDITPHCLVLELTESLIMEDSERAIGTMHHLSSLGVRIALDDFGTGYSSLSYLTRFPMDKIKIDRSFIIPIGSPNAHESEAIVKSVISMAQALDLRVIAEGVEVEEQADFLRINGCDEIQGYFLSKPLPESAFRTMLEETLERRKDQPGSTFHALP
jgi:diguanylate cyclase (GGDEF)-like protein/PAS domain S-box-containing protein